MNEMKSSCERETDLISYLYGELDATAVSGFEQHLSKCSRCSEELAGFKSVRESVVAWRNESLGFGVAPADAPVAQVVHERKRSAIAALREFFDLSPLWLKGALTFAALVLCLLAGFGVIQWQKNVQPVVVMNGYSQEQVNKMVADARQEERNQLKVTSTPTETVAQQPKQQTPNNFTVRRSVASKPGQKEYARRPLSRTERQQLAADLRLLSNERDIDLLGDNINQ
jgi:anti-sigma factor RsiW